MNVLMDQEIRVQNNERENVKSMNTPTGNNISLISSKMPTSEIEYMHQILNELSLEQRECILLQQDFSLWEIADLLDFSLHEVKKFVEDGRNRFVQKYRLWASKSRLRTDDFDMLFVGPCDNWIDKLIAVHPDDLTSLERDSLFQHMKSCYICNETHRVYFIMDIHIRRASNTHSTFTFPPVQQQLPKRQPITENLTADISLLKILDGLD